MTRTRIAVLGGVVLLASVPLFALAWDLATDPPEVGPPRGGAPPEDPAPEAPATEEPSPEAQALPTPAAPVGSCDISVSPGQSIQAALDSGPPGRTVCIRAGVHRIREPLRPRTGTRIVGEPGAHLNGSKVVRRWTRRGRAWVARGQRTGPTIQCMSGVPCGEVLRREAIYGDDLFIRGVPLERVLSRRRLGPRVRRPARARFFFDYKANQIWLNIRPGGRRIEVAVAEGLIAGSGSVHDVTVEGLVMERSAGFGVSSEGGTGWTVANNEIRHNHTKGIRMWAGARVIGNQVHHNGQYGVAASDGPGIVVEGNRIHDNNLAGYRIDSGYWDAGGSKFVRTTGLILRGNQVHGNHGDGLWVDTDNVDVTIEGNTITDNERFGIFYEISGPGTIRGNTIAGNDEDAIRITSSHGVTVTGNTIEVVPDDPAGGGIRLEQDHREGEGFLVSDVAIQGNTLTMCRGTSGARRSFGGDAIFQERNNRFEGNTYRVPSGNARAWEWMNGLRTWSEWQSFGLDGSGSVQEVSC